MTGLTSGRRSGWQIFRWPIALALASSAGLVGTLLDQSLLDLVWITAVATPCAPIIVGLCKRRFTRLNARNVSNGAGNIANCRD